MYSNIRYLGKKFSTGKALPNPYASLKKSLKVGTQSYDYFSIQDLKDDRVGIVF